MYVHIIDEGFFIQICKFELSINLIHKLLLTPNLVPKLYDTIQFCSKVYENPPF